MLKRSWTEIDLGRIKKNYEICKGIIGNDKKVMAVVKADAYGHGEAEVSRCLQDLGVTDFAVSNIEEALALRDAGVKGQVLVLGYTPVTEAGTLYDFDITQAILSDEYAKALKETGVKVKVQFAVDTGMNRIGIDGDDAALCEKTVREYLDCFEVTGIFTHLCVADTPSENEFTQSQIDKFKSVVKRLEDLKLPYIHCLNSAGGLWQEGFGNLVRLGIVLYGLKPDPANTLPEGIKPAMSWKTVVSVVKTIKKGETVGYGRRFTAEKDTVIATLTNGYADGYPRLLSCKGKVLINGKFAPVVGGVCMDQMMVDVTGIEGVELGTEVELLSDEYNADDVAETIGTVGYEIICGISKRVNRIYK